MTKEEKEFKDMINKMMSKEQIEELENFKPKITLKRIWYTIEKNHKHISLVRKLCFKCGVPINGLLHDLSKWSFVEFFGTAKYFLSKSYSPILVEQYFNGGRSKVKNHHLKVNKHHSTYWYDEENDIAYEMPYNILVELICDTLSASITYAGGIDKWDAKRQLNFWKTNAEKQIEKKKMHPMTIMMQDLILNDMVNRNCGIEILNKKYLKYQYNKAKEILKRRKLVLSKIVA